MWTAVCVETQRHPPPWRSPPHALALCVTMEMVAVVDKEVAWRSSGGRWLWARPLTERGEGSEPILGVLGPGFSPETSGNGQWWAPSSPWCCGGNRSEAAAVMLLWGCRDWWWTRSGCSGLGFLRIGGQGGFDAPSNGWHLLKKLLGDRWFLGHPNGGPHDDLCTVETVYFLWCNLERKNSCSTFMMKVLLFSGLGLAVSICSFICVLSRKICYSFGCNKKTCNFFWSS
jgi:hypothetical protein